MFQVVVCGPGADCQCWREVKFPFANLTGRGVRVAVVDSGIVPRHPRIGPVAGGIGLSLGRDGGLVRRDDHSDCAGHGTACAGIIRRKAPKAELFSVRIFDESLEADGRLLIAAIEWAVDCRMDVVNLSLGTTEAGHLGPLAEVCRTATDQGLLLVAADHEEGRASWPAVFPQVIGVGASSKAHGLYKYHYRPGAEIECLARGDPQRLCWLDPAEVVLGGTSFAAPHVTGLLALVREARPGASLAEVRPLLETYGEPEPAGPRDQEPSEPPATEDFAWIGRAALYPYNKEMHALVRGRDLLGFKIVGVGDPVGKGLVGKDAGTAIGVSPAGLRIEPRLASALKEADTLILGYVDELSRIRKRDLLREAVEVALEQGTHVFSLLPLPREPYADLYERAESKGLRLYYPRVSTEEARHTLYSAAPCPAVDVPVVAVMGTSSQQGKFTLQVGLRRYLQALGYRVGQLGTEHHAGLFGMDCAFPMGYASSVDIPLEIYPSYLDAKLREINRRRRPHLILAGSQSGTVPYNVSEPETHTLPAIAFLMGVRPDACLLVVNSVDREDYIQDTIDGIRAICQAPVLLLAMSDKQKHVRVAYGRASIKPRQMTEEAGRRKLRILERTFDRPAVSIASEAGIEKAGEIVIDHFADSVCRTCPG